MTDGTRVVIQDVYNLKVYVPGPVASKASNILARIRDLAVEGGRLLRYAEESRLDIARMERVEEELHAATRPMRHGLAASARNLDSIAAGVNLYAHNTDAEEADTYETESGGSP